jgi:uroporphyrinogen III methyltransferase/synthase
MGMRRLAENVERLRQAGHQGEEPAAVIEWGTLPRQRTVVSTLDRIAVDAAGLGSPAVLVVGEVVRLRERLSWFERLPLFGRRVLVTRTRQQAPETCRALEELGAETLAMPTIAIRPPDDPEPLRRAMAELSAYDWVIVTSANAVAPLRQALEEQGLDARAFARARLCAIGPGTAAALAELGLRPDLVPEDHRAEGILERLGPAEVGGKRVLLPRAVAAREVLPRQLAERGARVDVVPVYQTGLPEPAEVEPGLRALEAGELDVLTFTSASTAENFAAILGDRLPALTAGKLVCAIGPVTRDACLRVGLTVEVMPERYTIQAMVQALAEHFGAGAAPG